MDSLSGVMLAAGLNKIVLMIIALAIAVVALRWFDRRCNFSFSRWLDKADKATGEKNTGYGIYLGLRFLGVCVLIGLMLGCSTAQAASFHTKYDHDIKSASDRWMPGVDWRLWKAQLYQESHLKPEAVSPVGARGIAQIMPGTWKDVSRAMGYGAASPHVAELAIEAGAYYMGGLRKSWSAPRPEADRHSLAMASYNAGLGNLLKAQRVAGGAASYHEIISALPKVTGHHSKETTTYVQRIWGYWQRMLLGA